MTIEGFREQLATLQVANIERVNQAIAIIANAPLTAVAEKSDTNSNTNSEAKAHAEFIALQECKAHHPAGKGRK